MKRRGFFLVLVFFMAGVAACGTQSTTDEDNGAGALSSLQTFGDEVKLCTPYLGDSTLEQWADWDPDVSGSVLGKLFDPDNGGFECIYSHIDLLDAHIEMVNEFVEDWDEDGQYIQGDMTATIDNDTSAVTIPYLGIDLWPISVDRVITLENVSQDLVVHMAFSIDGDREYIVEQYAIGNTDAGVYYTERDGDSLRIWHASITTGSVQFVWEGDVYEEWFKITQCSDATGNWEAMGGGSVSTSSSQMAFMARNDDTNDSLDEYYLTLTLNDLVTGNEPSGGIVGPRTDPLSGTGVLAYITLGNAKCFGFLGIGEYPDNTGDLAWDQ